jgi:hypothetical protein
MVVVKVLDLVKPNGDGGGRCGLGAIVVGQVLDLVKGKGG